MKVFFQVKMPQLQQFICSYIPDFLANVKIPKSWLKWHKTVTEESLYKKINFKAETEQEWVDQLKPILSYLDDEDLKQLYQKKECYFAGPSLLIHYSVRMMLIKKYVKEIKGDEIIYEENRYCLEATGVTERKPESYRDRELHGDSPYHPLLFEEKAIQYAKQNWGSVLQVQPPMDFTTYIFKDPSQPGFFGGAKSVFGFVVGLNRDYNEIINDKNSSVDDHIVLIMFDKVLIDEIKSGGGGYSESPVCIFDGSSLMKDHFKICKHQFSEDHFNMYGGPPLGNRIYTYLQNNEKQIRKYFKLKTDIKVVPDLSKQ